MHALTAVPSTEPYLDQDDWDASEVVEAENPGWVMKKLKPKHRDICALLAQGFKNVQIAAVTGVTKEYVSMLQRQPLIKQEIARLCEIAGTRMEALFVQTTEAVADVLANGKDADRMKAARLQMEVTGRVGTRNSRIADQVPADERLERLAGRLIDLLGTNRSIAHGDEGTSAAPIEGEFRQLPGRDNSEEAIGQFQGQPGQESGQSEGPSASIEG